MNKVSASRPKLKIALAGTGVVGSALIQLIQTQSLPIEITRCLIRRKRPEHPIAIPSCDTLNDLIQDPEVQAIVEATNDTGFALALVREATLAGKPVITANKQLIATHLHLIKKWQSETGTPVLYESTCGAGIPMIRLLEDYYRDNSIHEIRGILNGSTNYILTRMHRSGCNFREALLEAQQAGYAEKDPKLDIEGTDAAAKLCILLEHAFGCTLQPHQLLSEGIQRITEKDQQEAASRGYCIKLIAKAGLNNPDSISAWILPAFIPEQDSLHDIQFENNALEITDRWNNRQLIKGRGAGGTPTAAGLIHDLLALRNGYRYPYQKAASHAVSLDLNQSLKVYFRFEGFFEDYARNFEQIEQFSQSELGGWITGWVNLKSLRENVWWREASCCLIAFLEPAAAQIAEHQVHRRALELACAPVFKELLPLNIGTTQPIINSPCDTLLRQ